MEKINILSIFKDHFKTLIVYHTKKISYPDIFLFYGLPLAVGIFASRFFQFKSILTINSDLMVFYAGAAGFLLNVLVLLYGYDTAKFKNPGLASYVLKETSSNIAYLITIAALAIIVLFGIELSQLTEIVTFSYSKISYSHILFIQHLSTGFICFSLLNFLLTMLMVLKRFYSLDSNTR